jgi:hypothetical protein
MFKLATQPSYLINIVGNDDVASSGHRGGGGGNWQRVAALLASCASRLGSTSFPHIRKFCRPTHQPSDTDGRRPLSEEGRTSTWTAFALVRHVTGTSSGLLEEIPRSGCTDICSYLKGHYRCTRSLCYPAQTPV